MIKKIKHSLANLGPGLLYAGAAVGVSHLIMSTKAGAIYEFAFLVLIPLIHVIKYPFYKFGPEYTALTGRNILHGYYALGKWALITYVSLTLLSMCLIQAAVTIVTSSIAVYFFNLKIPAEYLPHVPAILVLIAAAAILYVGKYSTLDKLMKVIILILTVTTLIALGIVLLSSSGNTEFDVNDANSIFHFSEYSDIIFLAAFLGWMPAPMDISVWHSVWSEENNRVNKRQTSLKQTILDFNIGFFGTAFLAMAFLALGAMVMYGSGEKPSQQGAVFAGQLIEMYTDTLGSWAYPLIGIAALATMFSTTLTCLDAYPRTLEKSYFIWKQNNIAVSKKTTTISVYNIMLLVALVGTLLVFVLVKYSSGTMGLVVTIATVVSFISAPVIAYINYKVMHGDTIKKTDRPNKITTHWCQFGILIMVIFSLTYLVLIIPQLMQN